MSSAAMTVNDMLNSLEEEDYKMAISYIQFLSDSRRKERVEKAEAAMEEFQAIIGEDRVWSSEEEMLADMAEFRRERMRT